MRTFERCFAAQVQLQLILVISKRVRCSCIADRDMGVCSDVFTALLGIDSLNPCTILIYGSIFKVAFQTANVIDH